MNLVTNPDVCTLLRFDDVIDSVGNVKFVTKIDILKEYYQTGLSKRAQEFSAFIAPFGLLQYLILPFGMSNASATFQQVIFIAHKDFKGI